RTGHALAPGRRRDGDGGCSPPPGPDGMTWRSSLRDGCSREPTLDQKWRWWPGPPVAGGAGHGPGPLSGRASTSCVRGVLRLRQALRLQGKRHGCPPRSLHGPDAAHGPRLGPLDGWRLLLRVRIRALEPGATESVGLEQSALMTPRFFPYRPSRLRALLAAFAVIAAAIGTASLVRAGRGRPTASARAVAGLALS